MSNLIYYERNLPHRLPPGQPVFLTFRLADSLPLVVLARLRTEFSTPATEAPEPVYAHQRRYFGRFDELLDGSRHGPTWLGQPEIAALVAQALHFSHAKAYHLTCFCLMPNHVHAVVTGLEHAPPLATVLQHLKGYTAQQANRLLGRTGQFWQRETYDHLVRNGEEMTRIIAYVLNNPVKAGLVEHWQQWPHSYWEST